MDQILDMSLLFVLLNKRFHEHGQMRVSGSFSCRSYAVTYNLQNTALAPIAFEHVLFSEVDSD